MFDWIKENSTAFVIAMILHLFFFGALLFNWQMDKPKKIVLEQGDVIQVTSVDANTYDAEIQKIEQQKRAEKQLKVESERKAKELKKKKKQEEKRRQQEKKRKAEELKQKKAAAAKKKEEQRKAALIKEKQLKEKQLKEKQLKELKLKEKRRKEAEKKVAEEKRKQEARRKEEIRKKAEQEKQRRLEEQKKQQEAERKRQAAEKKRQLAELKRKEERDRLERERRSKGIVNRHVGLIAQKIERNWRQPLGAPSNLQCKIDIVLLPSGNVVSVKVVESSGNLSFDRSVETAVRKASPLPVPADSVIFKEFEVMRLRFEPGSY